MPSSVSQRSSFISVIGFVLCHGQIELSARLCLISWCYDDKMGYKTVQVYTSSHVVTLSGYIPSIELRQEKYV
jgi:hypothetical protein